MTSELLKLAIESHDKLEEWKEMGKIIDFKKNCENAMVSMAYYRLNEKERAKFRRSFKGEERYAEI